MLFFDAMICFGVWRRTRRCDERTVAFVCSTIKIRTMTHTAVLWLDCTNHLPTDRPARPLSTATLVATPRRERVVSTNTDMSYIHPYLHMYTHAHRTKNKTKQEKLKAKEASSATSIMASSLKSTLGSLFESSSTAAAPPASTAAAATATPSRQQSLSATSSVRSTSGSFALLSPVRGGDAPATAAAAAGGAGAMGAPSPSMLGRFSAMKSQMPSLRDLLFDDAQGPSGSASGSRASSRHGGGGGGGSRHSKLPSSSNRPPSESGVTVRAFFLLMNAR